MPAVEETRASRAQAQVATRNGRCLANQAAGANLCKCEAFELAGFADGFSTCVCGHTRWAHANTWVSGRDTVAP